MRNSNPIQTTSYLQTKFKFSDLRLSYIVRNSVSEALKKFDRNHNGLFQENQLKQAMISILGQDENQVQYAVKNIFRYDKNNDKLITYDQFTNFSVQQHFGQMAIQRLHRKNFYSKGSQRIMNMEQFKKTLYYCFQFIKVSPTQSELKNLFKQVDLNQDGFISYEDYFVFLRQYFGSKSQAYQSSTQQSPPKATLIQPTPKKIKKYYKAGESPQQRIAQLIFSQLKICAGRAEIDKKLRLQKHQVQDLVNKLALSLSYQQKLQFLNKYSYNYKEQKVAYQQVVRNLAIYLICDIDFDKIRFNQMDYKQFSTKINQTLKFLQVKPSENLLSEFFNNHQNRNKIDKLQYCNTMRKLLSQVNFDKRGIKI